MALQFGDRARMTTATAGTGTITLGAAVASSLKGYFQSFAAAGITDGATVHYVIEDGTAWETGIGVYTASGTTLSRTLVASSTGALLALSGAAEVYVSLLSQDVLDFLRRSVEGQTITGGAGVTSKDLGNSSGVTLVPDPSARPLQHLANNGAFTLNPPTVSGAMMLDIINGAGAGAITLGAWTKGELGGGFDTTSGHKWRCHISLGQGGSLLMLEPLF